MTYQKTVTLSEVAADGVRDSYADHAIYRYLADSHNLGRSSPRKKSAVLEELSETEYRHYEFWKKYSPETTGRVSKLKLYALYMIYAIFGAMFAISFLERHEKANLRRYKSVESAVDVQDRPQFEQILKEKEERGARLGDQIQSSVVKYMSFVVLGLADAIVEISGIHAGSLGVYNSTKLTGLAGIVAGAAASISMASAAFAQAKQGFKGSPKISALVTGVSYFINAVLLAAPYFFTSSTMYAMTASLMIGLVALAFTSYYNSIISGARFLRDFGELAGIMFGATVALFLFGQAIRVYLGIAF